MTISKKKYSNEFTIIYIIFAPISYYYEKFLNINNLEKNSFKTKICDISDMFYSKKQQKNYFHKTSTFYNPKVKNIIKIKNFKNYKNFIDSLDKDKTIIYYTGRGFYSKYDDKLLFDYIYDQKFKIFLSEFGIEFYPNNLLENIKLKFFLLRHRFFLRRYKQLNFIGSGANIKKIANFIYRDLNYISCPHPNFNWKKLKNKKNFTIYVEEALDGSPDGNVCEVTAPDMGANDFIKIPNTDVSALFYKKLNNFFLNFEKKHNTNIIIASSGKYFYRKNPFEKRKIIYGDTINLINSSKYVIGHNSYALYQSVISNKKIALIDDNLLSKYKKREILRFSKRTKTPINNLSSSVDGEPLLYNNNLADRNEVIEFFLNDSKIKKNFDQFMIDCFSNSFKDI